MTDPARLSINYDRGLDWLMAYEFGRVDDGQPAERWRGVSESFGFLHDAPGGRVIGFKVLDFSEFEPEDKDVQAIWEPPLFDAPTLGLTNATAGEVVLAAATHFAGRSSLGRELFSAASGLQGEEAADMWRRCLEAGDAMAHFGLGYTLLELDRPQEAYRHLRYYSEIAPNGPWTWCWYGRAAAAMGEVTEARRAWRRAIELTEAGGEETDAAELLWALEQTSGASAPAKTQSVALWGDEMPQLGRRRIDSLSRDAAAGLTAGAKAKGYAYTDPNEDVVVLVEQDDATVLICADGHNGVTAPRVAVQAATEGLQRIAGLPFIDDDTLVDLWLEINERVLAAGPLAGQPESRTTLVIAVVREGEVRWASMGDSLLAVIDEDGLLALLSKPASHFVGWPMTRDEVAARLVRGNEVLNGNSWVIAATDGLTDFAPGLFDTLAGAVEDATGASAVVESLIDSACAGGAGDNVGVGVVRAHGFARYAPVREPTTEDRIRGCIFGGAVGDALGAPVEFDSIGRIRKRFGPAGITDFHPAFGRLGAITDDTQMSLFTAEGLIRAYVRGCVKGISHPPGVVDHAYARWLATQGEVSPRWSADDFDGWLNTHPELFARRAPGNTCLSALRADRAGTIAQPINDSKGCGSVMRAAPGGLLGPAFPGDRFDLACEIGALTHGHPSGYLAAGALADIIAWIVWQSFPLEKAVGMTIGRLTARPGHDEVVRSLQTALDLARLGTAPSPEAISQLGEGWVAEEALAIGVYCALVADGFESGAILAVNHSGDSDSTGAIAGNLLGAIYGFKAIPDAWVTNLELGDAIAELCDDWTTLFAGEVPVNVEWDSRWWERYPGW